MLRAVHYQTFGSTVKAMSVLLRVHFMRSATSAFTR
jgi:hypothetical protein